MYYSGKVLFFLVFCFVFPDFVMAEEASTGSYDEAVEESRRLFESGDYNTTIEFLIRAYEEHDEPIFLQNIGRCYARLENFCEASEYYQRFLDEGQPDEVLRVAIEGRIEDYNRRCEASRVVSDPDPDPADPTVFGQEPQLYDPSRLYLASYIQWGLSVALGIAGGVCWGVAYGDRFQADGATAISYAGDGLFFGGFIGLAVTGLVTYLVGYFRLRRSRVEHQQEARFESNYAYADF